MNKKLAIKGHPTRGKEVIELFKMMGGKNVYDYECINPDKFYVLDEHIYWVYDCPEETDKCKLFTFEEFLNKYPYKVGDKIPDVWGNPHTVKSMSWDVNYKTVMYGFEDSVFVVRADELKVTNDIGLKIEKNTNMNIEFDLTKYSYEVKDGRLVISEKKPVYPKTYEECYEVIGISRYDVEIDLSPPFQQKMFNFFKLLICRDAYWKIAGEQMGLDKPWEPDWLDTNTQKYCIYYVGDEIKKQPMLEVHHFLAFPTAEMRDAFYENFNDLIEKCKELL